MIVGWEGREGRTKHLESAEASGLPPPRSDLLLPAGQLSIIPTQYRVALILQMEGASLGMLLT